MRIFAGLIFIVLFIGWALYHLLIKKDLKQHKGDLYAGLFFMGVWGVLYYWILE